MPRDDEIYKRAREVMCRTYGNCDGCPIRTAAMAERVKCGEFQRRFPGADRQIVTYWQKANMRTMRETVPDDIPGEGKGI